MTNPVLDHLETRRSVKADELGEPGPDSAQLSDILRIAARVPDHKKLVPWRFIVFEGTRRAIGERLAHIIAGRSRTLPRPAWRSSATAFCAHRSSWRSSPIPLTIRARRSGSRFYRRARHA